MKKRVFFRNFMIFVACIACLSGCGTNGTDSPASAVMNSKEPETQSEAGQNESSAETEATDETEKAKTMNITLGEKTYAVSLDENETVDDITANLPLDLSMTRYAGHEYYAELPYTPIFDEARTSEIKAGHIYYWDGWNAFVINYIDYDIAPYQVVHIGEIADKSIVDVLTDADEDIAVKVTE